MGNYWSDYKEKYPDAKEIDGCGIRDTSYSIDDDNDTYPLMEPWENYFTSAPSIFDTGPSKNPYPSIMGKHIGTIKPYHDVNVSLMYSYPGAGTGGHSEYVKFWNSTWNVSATWKGYKGDWHNITFDVPFVLVKGKIYNYTIRTGSYLQIHHADELKADDGIIRSIEFIDANGKIYKDWIPAIRLEWVTKNES